MQNVKEAGAHWIAHHLKERWPERPAEAISQNLDAIASEYEIPIELVIEWIHLLAEDVEISSETFRTWAKRYAEERDETLAAVGRYRRCRACAGALTRLASGDWRCLRCGAEVKV